MSYKVMIVDDEAIVRESIARQIDWGRYQMELTGTAENAAEALAMLKERPVDLMLVDIRLPMIDGLELVRQVRRLYPSIQFIMISGYADFEYAREAMRSHALDYLLKPLNPVSLLTAIRKAQDTWEQNQFAQSLSDLGMNIPSEMPEQHSASSPTVIQILAIVDEEIANPELSLKWISSQRMYLNETYLSKLFQREIGEKFSSYLMHQRMTLAMRLMLRSPQMQIQEIAEQTGFGDNPQYFSSVFHRFTNMTPSEFRKKLSRLSFGTRENPSVSGPD